MNTTALSSSISIKQLLERLGERRGFFLGYPYNLQFDYQNLLPLLQYVISNVGVPYIDGMLGLNSKDFEREVLRYFGELYRLPENDSWGYITSCGTEGNLYGLLLGRELYPDGILYGSEDCHYSIAKAARMFRLPFIQVKSQSNGEIDYCTLRQLLAANRTTPAIINLNVGTTVKGAIDDLNKVVEILEDLELKEFHIHIDAALAGMLIPFMEDATPLTFSQYPIGSIAVSGHKFIGSPIPCGIVLVRKHKIQSFEVDYIGSTDTTIMGSRSGLAAVILWEAIRQRQHQFADEVLRCRQNAEYRFVSVGFCPLNSPSQCVAFKIVSRGFVLYTHSVGTAIDDCASRSKTSEDRVGEIVRSPQHERPTGLNCRWSRRFRIRGYTSGSRSWGRCDDSLSQCA
jgi:histidine decarboxylase